MAVGDATKLLASATHGSAIGIPTAFGYRRDAQFLKIRDAGQTGPGSIGEYLSDFNAFVRWLVGGAKAVDGARSSLVVVLKKMDGATSITYAAATMAAGAYGFAMDRDAPPGSYDQDFHHEGDMDSEPITIS